jgi:hypothetical protein
LTPECLVSLSSVDFDFLSFLGFLLIVLSGFLGVGRAWLESGLHSCGLKYDRVTSVSGPASSRGNMWATSASLRAQQLRRNDADSRAQIRANTASIMGAKTCQQSPC